MTRLATFVFVTIAFLAFPAGAQQDTDDWLASARAREFRMRVAQLAVIYGDSRGIDPHGLLVTARSVDGVQPDCADVEVAVLAKDHELLHERVRACRHGAADAAPRPHQKVSVNALRQALMARFPLHFAVPGLFDVRVDARSLALMPATQRVGATLVARLSDLATGQVYPAEVDVTFALRYEPSDRSLRAHDLHIPRLRAPALPPEQASAWQALVDNVVRGNVQEVVLHRFSPEELRLSDVLGFEPEKITVEDDGVEIGFGPKPTPRPATSAPRPPA